MRFPSLALLAAVLFAVCPGRLPAEDSGSEAAARKCESAHEVTFYPGIMVLQIEGLSTCGHIDDYNATCLGSYDNGEDYMIRLEVEAFMFAMIELDPHGTAWTGIALDDVCPPDGDCLAMSTKTSGVPHYTPPVMLEPGVYYIIVDTWPTPYCIPEFDVTISEVFYDPWGVDCDLPIGFGTITPAVLPYTEGPFSTAGSGNQYTATCLSGYDLGEDLFYSFELTSALGLNFTLDPGQVAGSAFLISSDCPVGSSCIASATSNLADPFGIEQLVLPPGEYYLMIDTWSTSTPLTNAMLAIEFAYLCGDADGSQVISISDAIYVIGYIFGGGPPPVPLRAGDADTNGIVNISDAIYLINYIFAGGPPPCS